MSLNLFHTTGLFRYPLKTSENLAWNGLMSSNFNKILSVRHDIYYNFPSGIINVENKGNDSPFFVTRFCEVFRSYPPTPFDNRPKFCTK